MTQSGHGQELIEDAVVCLRKRTFISGERLLAVLHKMANDCSQHLWSFPCDVLE
jgi:hypothetical protein